MPECVFNTCCGCIELRTGCLIIGYLNLVGEIIMIAMGLTGLLVGGVVAVDGKDERAQNIGSAAMAVSYIFLLIAFFLFAFTFVLLVGVHQNKRGLVRAYLIYSYVCLVLFIIGLFASIIGSIESEELLKNLIMLLLSIYFTLVIRSHYLKMDDNWHGDEAAEGGARYVDKKICPKGNMTNEN